ncbi:hypothetical protein N7453_002365 [Penicillium expansum]|nr:hypothetical protein N7453_002365 [Penicillium expansum]
MIILIEVLGYTIDCADTTDKTHGKVHVMPHAFFKKHKLNFDYDNAKLQSYQANQDPEQPLDHSKPAPAPTVVGSTSAPIATELVNAFIK